MDTIGVDGCRGGWFYIRLGPDQPEFGVTARAETLLNLSPTPALILIDMPIGLREKGAERTCDTAARQRLGPRRSSVFPAPCRPAVYADSYQAANTLNRRQTERGLSKQSWHLAPKIRELDQLLSSTAVARDLFRESHPELCFWAFNGRVPLPYSKKSAAGQLARQALLKDALPTADELIAAAAYGCAGQPLVMDDILDALVLAIAGHLYFDRLVSLPELPELDAHGLPMEIVYPDC